MTWQARELACAAARFARPGRTLAARGKPAIDATRKYIRRPATRPGAATIIMAAQPAALSSIPRTSAARSNLEWPDNRKAHHNNEEIIMRSQLLAVSALIACTLSFGAAAPAAAAPQSDWDAVVAAAKQEGKVVVYSGSVGVPDNVAVMKDFEKKYGIKVELLESRAAELRERLRTELSLNRPSADVIYNSVSMLNDNEREGMLQPFGPLPLENRLVPPFKTNGTVLPVMVLTYGLLINTNMVPEADAPASWKDVLDPKWKSKMLMDDPRAPGGASLFFTVALNELGRPFLEALAAQTPTMSRENRQAGMRIARGEFPMYFPFSMADGIKLKGLPVKAYYPEEGAPYLLFGLGMVKTAAHPNAARLLINHFLETESARPFHLNGRAVTFQSNTEGLDPALLPLIDAKLLGTQARSAEHIDLAKELFK